MFLSFEFVVVLMYVCWCFRFGQGVIAGFEEEASRSDVRGVMSLKPSRKAGYFARNPDVIASRPLLTAYCEGCGQEQVLTHRVIDSAVLQHSNPQGLNLRWLLYSWIDQVQPSDASSIDNPELSE